MDGLVNSSRAWRGIYKYAIGTVVGTMCLGGMIVTPVKVLLPSEDIRIKWGRLRSQGLVL